MFEGTLRGRNLKMKKNKENLSPRPIQPNLPSINTRGLSKSALDSQSPMSARKKNQSPHTPRKTPFPKESYRELSAHDTPNRENIEKIDRKVFSTIQAHLKKAQEYSFEITKHNHSAIIDDLDFLNQSKYLTHYFNPFQKEANEYLHQLGVLKTPIQKIPVQDLKSCSFTFLQKWKEFLRIIDIIRESGYSSMYDYLSLKFRKIDFVISDIIAKNRRQSVHVETLEKRGGNLQALVRTLKSSVQQLLLMTDITSLDPTRLDLYINDIKTFMRLYNDVHFKEFPKSGYMMVELTQFKADVMSVCNDIIEGIRAAFNLSPQLDLIVLEANEVTSSLQDIINKLNLMSSFYRSLPREKRDPSVITDQNADENSFDISKIEEFVETDIDSPLLSSRGPASASICDPQRNIVMCSKLEEFFDDMDKKLKTDTKMLNKNVWDRLEMMKMTFFDKLTAADQHVKVYSSFQDEIKRQGKEIIDLMNESHQKSEEMIQQKQNSEKEIENLKNKIVELESRNEETLEIVKKKDTLIKQIREDKANEKAKKAIVRIGQKMGSLMNGNEENLHFDQDESIQTVDKMSVFVLERRCSKCREYESMRKGILDILKDIIGLREGETILDAIKRLKDEVIDLREKNARLLKDNEKLLFDLTALRTCLVELLGKINAEMLQDNVSLENKTIQELSEIAFNTFDHLKKHHRNEMNKLKESLTKKHNGELFEISNKLKSLSSKSQVACDLKHCLRVELEKQNGQKDQETGDPQKSIKNSANYKDFILEQISMASIRMDDTEADLKFAKDLLFHVEKWMNDQCEMGTEHMPIDEALNLMMKTIENKPNPLEPIVNRLENDIYLLAKGLTTITRNIQTIMQRVDIDKNPDEMELFEMLNYVQFEITEIINHINKNSDKIRVQEEIINQCRSAFNIIGKKMFHLLQKDDSIFRPNDNKDNSVSMDEIILQCLTAVEDVANPKSRFFISIADLNQLTKDIRSNADLPSSLDPVFYLPLLDDKMKHINQTFKVMKMLQQSLMSIFTNFDFKIESFDADSVQLSMLRENIFHMQNVLTNLTDGESVKDVNDVIQRFVSLSALFVHSIVNARFHIQTANKEEETKATINQPGNIYTGSTNNYRYQRHPYFKL